MDSGSCGQWTVRQWTVDPVLSVDHLELVDSVHRLPTVDLVDSGQWIPSGQWTVRTVDSETVDKMDGKAECSEQVNSLKEYS